MAATEVVEVSASMPWYGWTAVVVLLGFFAYRGWVAFNKKRTGGGGGGGGDRGGPPKHQK